VLQDSCATGAPAGPRRCGGARRGRGCGVAKLLRRDHSSVGG